MTSMSFTDLGLDASLISALEAAGYQQPTPVQQAAIPVLLSGKDLMASAQTGTGKTAAFMLPTLHRLRQGHSGAKPRGLILAPTRELAQQVSDAARKYGHGRPSVKVATLVGGASFFQQLRQLDRKPDLVIATPGRLLDHVRRGKLDLSAIEILILDEADRMLDLGFQEEVEAIAALLPHARQTALFSATLEGMVAELAQGLLNEPELLSLAPSGVSKASIEQRMHYADDMAHKEQLLDHWLTQADINQAIVFTATRIDAQNLAERLGDQGIASGALHGDMAQRDRNHTLNLLRRNQIKVLVATDVAARGIDVAGISHVFNFDLPRSAEDYVHRIGRTGRAGAQGTAISLVTSREKALLARIQRLTGIKMQAEVLPGLEPRSNFHDDSRGRRSSRQGQNQGYGRPRRDRFASADNRFDRQVRQSSENGTAQAQDGRYRSDSRPARSEFRGGDDRRAEFRNGDSRPARSEFRSADSRPARSEFRNDERRTEFAGGERRYDTPRRASTGSSDRAPRQFEQASRREGAPAERSFREPRADRSSRQDAGFAPGYRRRNEDPAQAQAREQARGVATDLMSGFRRR